VHDWRNTFVPHKGGGTRGRRHPPIWRCTQCGTRTESWAKPPEDMKLPAPRDPLRIYVPYSCEDYVAWQVMES